MEHTRDKRMKANEERNLSGNGEQNRDTTRGLHSFKKMI